MRYSLIGCQAAIAGKPAHTLDSCRSELAREKLTGAAFIQAARVIVDVFREQARSYSVCACRSVCASVSRAMSRLGWPLKVWLKRICW